MKVCSVTVTGQPLMRPYWVEFPQDETHFAKEDAFLVGPSVLVAPVMHQGSTNVEVHLPGTTGDLWYDYRSLMATAAPAKVNCKFNLVLCIESSFGNSSNSS